MSKTAQKVGLLELTREATKLIMRHSHLNRSLLNSLLEIWKDQGNPIQREVAIYHAYRKMENV